MKVNKLSPNFKVENIRQTVTFYRENFGFELNVAVPQSEDGVHQALVDDVEYSYAMMSKDGVQFMFQQATSFERDIAFGKDLDIAASVSFYMEIEGLEAFYKSLAGNKLELTAVETTWYGMREFYVRDINGYILAFAEKAAL